MTHWPDRELFGTIPAFLVGVNTAASPANQLERRLIDFAAAAPNKDDAEYMITPIRHSVS
jgi:hypothetical protein